MKTALLLLPALAISAPLRAESVQVGFAPPVARDYLYRIEQNRPIEGRPARFVTERTVRFERAGDGYILHATLRSLDSDAPPSGAEPYRAALSPLIGIVLRFRIDAAGRIVALENVDAVSAQFEAGLRALFDRSLPESPRRRSVGNVLRLFAGLDADGRLALLAGEFQPLLLFAGSTVVDGAGRQLRSMAGSPLGRPVPVQGSVTLRGQAGTTLMVEERLDGEGAQVAVDYRVARDSGLVMRQHRVLTMGPLTLEEDRTLEPQTP